MNIKLLHFFIFYQVRVRHNENDHLIWFFSKMMRKEYFPQKNFMSLSYFIGAFKLSTALALVLVL